MGSSAAHPHSRDDLIRIVRAHITSFSLPMQGPISGATHFIDRETALAALDDLDKERYAT